MVVCPVKDFSGRYIIPYYVSKEYNICSRGEFYIPGRFVLGNFTPERSSASYDSVLLAEEPAIAFVPIDFKVEMHYLRMRKYITPSKVQISNRLLIRVEDTYSKAQFIVNFISSMEQRC